MSYSSTVDEKYGGRGSSLSSDDLDASNLLNSTFVLAEGSIGYGNSTNAYYTADEDVYSLGILATGYYSLDVDDYTWDWGDWDSGSVSTFSLLNSYGAALDTKYGTYSDITFTVTTPDTYYAKIIGPSYGEAQYSVKYEKTGELAVPNSAAIFSDASITGDHVVGQTITANISYFDANGITGATPTVYWYADSGGLGYGTSNTYTLTESEVGKVIWAAVSFNDDLGNFEASAIFGGNTVADVNSDFTKPIVESFKSTTANGVYKAGDTINITATVSETVLGGSAINVTLSTGGVVTLTAASNGTTMTGNYTVGEGDTAVGLSVNSFYVSSSVADLAGNSLTNTSLPSGNNLSDNSALFIDGAAPGSIIS